MCRFHINMGVYVKLYIQFESSTVPRAQGVLYTLKNKYRKFEFTYKLYQ